MGGFCAFGRLCPSVGSVETGRWWPDHGNIQLHKVLKDLVPDISTSTSVSEKGSSSRIHAMENRGRNSETDSGLRQDSKWHETVRHASGWHVQSEIETVQQKHGRSIAGSVVQDPPSSRV